MITQDLIGRGGSKLEITRALIEADLGIPVPDSIWLYSGQRMESIKGDFERLNKARHLIKKLRLN